MKYLHLSLAYLLNIFQMICASIFTISTSTFYSVDSAESELHVEANENADNEHSNEEGSSNGSCPFDFEASRSRSHMSDPSIEAPKAKSCNEKAGAKGS